MSYSFPLLCQVKCTRTFWPAQSATCPETVSVKTSQLMPSMHAASVFIPPPGVMIVWSHAAEGPPGLGPTVPDDGFCARVVRSGIAQKKPILHIRKSVPRVIRAVIEEEFFFMDGLRG